MSALTDIDIHRDLAIFGAMVAIQVRDRMCEGRGAPDVNDMRRFIEEAQAVVELASEAMAPVATEVPR